MANILVIEGNNSVTPLLLDVMLQRLNHNILFATNSEEAFETLESQEIHLVIADNDLPAMNGMPLLATLRANEYYQELPVVLITTNGLEGGPDIDLDRGPSAYLNQPFSSWDLVRVLDSFLVVV